MSFRDRLNRYLPRRRFSFFVVLNILLILGVFAFVLSGALSPLGLKIALPVVITSQPVSRSGHVVIIAADNKVYVDGGQRSVSEWRGVFDAWARQGGPLLIKADKECRVGVLTQVWDVARQAGVREINIVTND